METPVPKSELCAISGGQMVDPVFYYGKLARVAELMDAGELPPLKAKQRADFWRSMYRDAVGRDLSESSRELLSPVELLRNDKLLELNAAELDKLEGAIRIVEELESKKKSAWLDLIARVRKAQDACRKTAMLMWVYVGRDAESGDFFHMAPVHARMFDFWADTEHPNYLIEAPPGSGKSTCFRGLKIWNITQDRTRRGLILCDDDEKAMKEIAVMKSIMRDKPYRALFPDVVVLARGDEQEDSRRRFTVRRPNTGSREPSFEAAGIFSRINGNGYDDMYIDDPCPEEIARQPSMRDTIWSKYNNEISKRFRNPERSRTYMICTPWDPQDLAGHIVTDVAEGRVANWSIGIEPFRVLEASDGTPIPQWPERFGVNFLLREKAKNLRAYNHLYRLQCVTDDEKIVRFVRYFPSSPDDPLMSILEPARRKAVLDRQAAIEAAEQWLSIDPSATRGRYSSELGVTQFALTSQGLCYVVGAWFLPGSPVEVQEWLLACLGGPKTARWRVPARTDFMLFEAQGGTTGQVVLWENYLRRECEKLGRDISGRVIKVGTKTVQGAGQNIGKGQRLKNVASYIEKYLRFPGRFATVNGKLCVVAGENPDINKLVSQIVNFPTGSSDGVDTVTQFLIYNESRLLSEDEIKEPIRSDAPQIEDTLRDGIRARLKALREPPVEDELEKEYAWLATN